jgi:hypothetical protein
VCLVNDAGELVEHTAAPPDADGLRRLAERLQGAQVRAVIESMTGARFTTHALGVIAAQPQPHDATSTGSATVLARDPLRHDSGFLEGLEFRRELPRRRFSRADVHAGETGTSFEVPEPVQP